MMWKKSLTNHKQIGRGFNAANVGNVASFILQITVFHNKSSSLSFADDGIFVPGFHLLVSSEPFDLVGFFGDGAGELCLLALHHLLVLRAGDELGRKFWKEEEEEEEEEDEKDERGESV